MREKRGKMIKSLIKKLSISKCRKKDFVICKYYKIRQFLEEKCMYVVDLLKNKQLINVNDTRLVINKYQGLMLDYNAMRCLKFGS